MKLKSSLVIALLAVALSAVVAVAAPSADAKKTGSVSTSAAGTTTTGLPVTGTFTITSFKVIDGAITAVGTFTGSVNGGETVTTPATSVVQAANGTSLPGGSTAAAAAAAAATCSILDLTLGPLHLDLLGLVVDLNQVHLQITAEQGSGNLLGNLLCAVAGLLDDTGTGGLSGLLQSIVNLLNQILGQL
jgi:hypothetical protein